MKFLGNVYNPYSRKHELVGSRRAGQKSVQAEAEYRAWLQGKVIGAPVATVKHTVDEEGAAS